MNKVKIEENRDGSFVVTMPDAGQRICMSAEQVADELASEERKFQKVVDDIKARRAEFEAKAAQP